MITHQHCRTLTHISLNQRYIPLYLSIFYHTRVSTAPSNSKKKFASHLLSRCTMKCNTFHGSVGRYSAQQQSKDFSDAFSICMHEAAFTPALHICFIRFLSSFAQTSVMAFCDLSNSCAGLILPFLCPFSEIAEYVPIWGRHR